MKGKIPRGNVGAAAFPGRKLTHMTPLPIDAVLPELLAALARTGAAVLRAPTGAGKTTRVPPALVKLLPAGEVILVEPRRVAARAAARRMASEDGSPLGERYGYRVRFESKAGPRCRAVACTPGVVLRMLDGDPFLERVSAVVFDEFHERGLETDLLLGLVKLLRGTVRPDLTVIVMSATLETGPLAAYLGDCPVVVSEGRLFPVEVKYRPRRSDTPLPEATAAAIEQVLTETPGDVLAFLPGMGEIRRTAERLTHIDAVVLPLHGDLPPEEQDRALMKQSRRKVVLATNVAEASVTVEGVTAVVDTGLARQQAFDASVGMDRLELRPISRASADQRAGRAGRTMLGVCVRLWDELGHRARLAATEPEIRRVDLANAVLLLAAQGEADPAGFPWLEPPPPASVTQAQALLRTLGALDAAGAITAAGRDLARLPVHPRLGRLLVEGAAFGIPGRAALAAALLSERDPFDRQYGKRPTATASDTLDRVEALEAFRDTGRLEYAVGTLHRGGAHSVWQAQKQLARLVSDCIASPSDIESSSDDDDVSLMRAVLAAYPDRVARRRGPGDPRALMVGGRGVRLGPSSGVEWDLFVCADVDAGSTESIVRQASGVKREWLPAELVTTSHEVVFDEPTGKLLARKQTRYFDLVLDDLPGHFADESRAAAVLADAALANLAAVLPDAQSAAGQFRTRLRCLAAWRPDLGLPTFDDGDLREYLPELCRGRRSLDEVRRADWVGLMRGALTFAQQQALDREAPATLDVPSGSVIALAYAEGKSPVLAARIQELFGLTETPRIAGGKVKVLLHLLAPNYRPQQVTDDLASFWTSGYAVVRKELRGRYPKHSWPDDPRTAEAIRGPKRRT